MPPFNTMSQNFSGCPNFATLDSAIAIVRHLFFKLKEDDAAFQLRLKPHRDCASSSFSLKRRTMAMADPGSRFGQPEKFCDIVLKGGITSGVVYPLALVSLAETYRFSNIGGTSAGAIAAAAAAAAEYGRHTENAGFDRLAKIPDEAGLRNLLSMFQPTPVLKPLFDIFVAASKAKTTTARVIAIISTAVSGGMARRIARSAAGWRHRCDCAGIRRRLGFVALACCWHLLAWLQALSGGC